MFTMQCTLFHFLNSVVADNEHELIQVALMLHKTLCICGISVKIKKIYLKVKKQSSLFSFNAVPSNCKLKGTLVHLFTF